jgi:hypothetical protein
MEGVMKTAFLFLVLMLVGTGFMYASPMADLSSFRNFCIRFLFPQ